MNLNKLRSSVLALVLTLSGVASVAQAEDFSVNDGDTVNASLAKEGLTRISIKGAKLEQVFSSDGEFLQIETDKVNGQVFVRYKAPADELEEINDLILPGGAKIEKKPALPKDTRTKQYSMFVTDDSGRTFTVNLSIRGGKSGDVVLVPRVPVKPEPIKVEHPKVAPQRPRTAPAIIKPKVEAVRVEQTLPSEVVDLTRDMVAEKAEVSGFDVKLRLNQARPLWKGADFRRIATYDGTALIGEVYLLTNRTGKELRFVESEFQGRGILGVSVRHYVLQKNESTNIYIVRERN
jgi:hypothetical protein